MPISPKQIQDAQNIQHSAAHDTSNEIRLVAGPGTGKSFAIEERISWLIDNGANPKNIFVVSFTRAAAIDLKNRIQKHCADRGITNSDELSVSTLHSLALRILRAAGLLSSYYPADPIVMDDWELNNIFDKEFSLVSKITKSRCKDTRMKHEAFWSTGSWGPPNYIPPDPDISDSEMEKFDDFHNPRTQVYSCVLPGEMILKCIQNITAGTLEPTMQLKMNHFIVDEYQDFNPCDLEFIDHMINNGVITFVAGDDDQSIYSFRFASPEGIQEFEHKYQSLGNHTLKDCFRCTPEIINAAESLITAHKLPKRIPKILNSLYASSNPPVYGQVLRWRFKSGIAESRAIAKSCQDLVDSGISPSDIIILLSNTKKLEPILVEELNKTNIEFEPAKSKDYYKSNDFRFALACLRIICNREDYIAHRVLLGSCQTVGPAICNNIVEAVLQKNLNYKDIFYQALPSGVFSTRELNALKSVQNIINQINSWKSEDTLNQRSKDLEKLLEDLYGDVARENWLDNLSNLPNEINLKELRDILWADNDEYKIGVLNSVYERLGVEVPKQGLLPQRIRIMTMHGSKGLDAKIVFIPGLEEDIIPGPRRKPYPGLVLEAARLLYMSITRAKIACVLSYADGRIVHGQLKWQTPSRFTKDLDGIFNYCDQGGLTAQQVNTIVKDIGNL